MYAPLDNETIFKRVFTDVEIFQQFVKDIFNVEITVGNIETEKKFSPPIAQIDIKLDIYAESKDHRFLIEIQKIDYDYNFNRFLNYFITLLIEQQKKGEKYEIPQTVLGAVVLTRPYKINQLTGEPIKDSVLLLDFDPRNLNNERIHLWNHKLIFLNTHSQYFNPKTPENFQDWLNLFTATIEKNINFSFNLKNKAIEKALQMIEMESLDPETLREMKISESRKAMLAKIEKEGYAEAAKKYEPLLEESEKQKELAFQREKEALTKEKEALAKEKETRVLSAKTLLEYNVPIEKIMQTTGLSLEEIEEIKKKFS